MLQREINIVVKKDFIEASSNWAGTSGEHKITVLVFDIQEPELASSSYEYRLQLNDTYTIAPIKGNTVRFELPQAALFETDVLQVQLTISQGEEQIYVSDIIDFQVSPNLCADTAEMMSGAPAGCSAGGFSGSSEELEKLSENLPYVDKDTLTWWIFDVTADKYADTGVSFLSGGGQQSPGFVKPENLSFLEHVYEVYELLSKSERRAGGVNSYGQIDESVEGRCTYIISGSNHVPNDIIYTQYCLEAVYVNSGGVTRIPLSNAVESNLTTSQAYTYLYIVVSLSDESKAKAWYENYGKTDEYVFNDERIKQAVRNCLNE